MFVFWQASNKQESVFNLLKTFFICFLLSGGEQVQHCSHTRGRLSSLAQAQHCSETFSEEHEAFFLLVGKLYTPWVQ